MDRRLELDGLDDLIGLKLGIAYTALTLQLRNRLSEYGLTPKQVSILWLIKSNSEISQVELSRFFNIGRASINQFVQSLLRKGLICFTNGREDRRYRGLELTGAGLDALFGAREIVRGHQNEFRRFWTDAEVAQFDQMLGHLLSWGLPFDHELLPSVSASPSVGRRR